MAPYSSTLAWKIPWQRSLVGCSPWGRQESDTTEGLHFHFSLSCIGEGNGNPLQCSCLENPRDREVWWAAVYGVAQSRTRLKRLSSSSSKHILTAGLQVPTALCQSNWPSIQPTGLKLDPMTGAQNLWFKSLTLQGYPLPYIFLFHLVPSQSHRFQSDNFSSLSIQFCVDYFYSLDCAGVFLPVSGQFSVTIFPHVNIILLYFQGR